MNIKVRKVNQNCFDFVAYKRANYLRNQATDEEHYLSSTTNRDNQANY